MENLRKIIKRLNEEEYKNLLEQVTNNKRSKPFHVLEFLRNDEKDEESLMEKLDVNINAFYTMKSRLLDKVASAMAHKPMNSIKEKVASVQSSIFHVDRFMTIKFLKDLEKELLEYDLSNELIVVYKALSRMYLFEQEEYDHYNLLYNKHVAYSLAMEKAEDLLLAFIRNTGNYKLSRTPEDYEKILRTRREFFNISEMFKSHRLYVLNNLISIYFQCTFITNINELKSKEMEVEEELKEMEAIFDKYPLDSFYQNIRPLIDFMYVQYHYSVGNIARGNVYYKAVKASLDDIIGRPFFNFFVINLLLAKLEKYTVDGNYEALIDLNNLLESDFEIDENEVFHMIRYHLFTAYTKFYIKDYDGVISQIEIIKKTISTHQYLQGCIECQLLLCLIYLLQGAHESSKKIMTSINRQFDLDSEEYKNVYLFLKFLKLITKHGDYDRRLRVSREAYQEFLDSNNGTNQILRHLKIDESVILKLADVGTKNT